MAGFREFQTGEVLSAANVNNFLMKQSVMVFADAAARTTALSGALVEGMLTYNKDTEALEVYDGTDFVSVGGAVKEKRIAAFTGSGTWTVPAGVTYAIAHMTGGGGGIGATPGGTGGSSSVAFAAGTVTAEGGIGADLFTSANGSTQAGATNSGHGASGGGNMTSEGHGQSAQDGAFIVQGADVTPAASITVTVGAAGTAGSPGAAGGSGYVYIEYYEEV